SLHDALPISSILELEPDHPWALATRAHHLNVAKRFAEALAAADAALATGRLGELEGVVHYRRGVAFANLDQNEAARVAFHRAADLLETAHDRGIRDGATDALHAAAVQESARQDFAAALALEDRALRIDYGSWSAHNYRALMLLALRRPDEEALRELDMAISLAPAQSDLYFHRAFLRKAAGDLRGALEDFEAFRRTPGAAPSQLR